jgi:hypothetical protein
MKKLTTLFLLFAFTASLAQAQEPVADTTDLWKTGGIFSLSFSNTSLSDNWQAGGVNTRALLGLVNIYAHTQQGKHTWNNNLDMAYGIINQGPIATSVTRKNEDRLDFTSKYGYNFNKQLALAGLFNLRTQFAPGFQFDEQGNAVGERISAAFAPAYINFGIGFDWKPEDNLSVYYSPINSKITFVGDENLRERYMPAEFADTGLRYELGSYMNIRYQKELWKNFTYQTKADFFLNYLQEDKAVDVNWENLLSLQATKWLGITFFTQLIYDKDIVADGEEVGLQFKHALGIGLTTSFGDKLD